MRKPLGERLRPLLLPEGKGRIEDAEGGPRRFAAPSEAVYLMWKYSPDISAGYARCSTWNTVRRPLGERHSPRAPGAPGAVDRPIRLRGGAGEEGRSRRPRG